MYDTVVLVSLDTLRSDGIAANPWKLWPQKYRLAGFDLRTGVLDELAAEGAFFANCIAAAPYTSAAHASLFTGRWPPNHGCYEFFNRKVRARTLFGEARRRGLFTLFKTDFPIILGPFLGFDRDVDKYIIEDDGEFLDALAANRRSFAFAHFGGLHIPYGFHNLRYGGQDYRDTVERLERGIPDAGGSIADRLVETYRDADDLALMIRYKRIVQHHYSIADYDTLFGLYLEGINRFIERRFTAFYRRLREVLRGRRWLLVVFGDHGEEYDADSYGHHNTLSEGVLRVPLIIAGDGVRPGLRRERVRSIDLAPTLLEALGWTGALRTDGESLARSVWGDEAYPQREAFAQAFTSETAEFVEFQRRLLDRGRKAGSLRHVLYKEAVYDADHKLSRQHFVYTENGGIWGLVPCEPRVRHETIGSNLSLSPTSDSAARGRLAEKLAGYNALRRERPGRTVKVTGDIRRDLRGLGYDI